MKRLSLCVVVALSSACGGTPTTPTPAIPQVAGAYVGTMTLVYPTIPRTLICPASTSVTQSGTLVSLAPLVLAGQCGGVSVALGQVAIDATGSFSNQSGSLSEPCGVYDFIGSGGFFGRELRISMSTSSRTCPAFNLTAILNR